MHLIPSDNIHHYNLEVYENNCFTPVIEEAQNLNQKINTHFVVTNDLDSDIAEFANNGDYDLLLIGKGQSIFEGSLLGRISGFSTRIINLERLLNKVTGKENMFESSPLDERTRLIISKSKVPVGVLIDKGFRKTDEICIPLISRNDSFLTGFARKLISFSGSQITFIDVTNQIQNNPEIKESIRAIEQIVPSHVHIMNEEGMNTKFLKQQNLMLISIESWKYLIETEFKWLTDIPSTLIIAEKA